MPQSFCNKHLIELAKACICLVHNMHEKNDLYHSVKARHLAVGSCGYTTGKTPLAHVSIS